MKFSVFSFLLLPALLVMAISPRAFSEEPAGETSDSQLMTQGQLIEVMVNTLGLATMLPPSPSQADMIKLLMQNGIVPQGGWQPGQVVTAGTLARVIVQTLGKSNMVENPQDDASWVSYLLSLGIDLSTIQSAIRQVPSADPNAASIDARLQTDPLKRYPFGFPFVGWGFTVQSFRQTLVSIAGTQIIPPIKPVTPN